MNSDFVFVLTQINKRNRIIKVFCIHRVDCHGCNPPHVSTIFSFFLKMIFVFAFYLFRLVLNRFGKLNTKTLFQNYGFHFRIIFTLFSDDFYYFTSQVVPVGYFDQYFHPSFHLFRRGQKYVYIESFIIRDYVSLTIIFFNYADELCFCSLYYFLHLALFSILDFLSGKTYFNSITMKGAIYVLWLDLDRIFASSRLTVGQIYIKKTNTFCVDAYCTDKRAFFHNWAYDSKSSLI